MFKIFVRYQMFGFAASTVLIIMATINGEPLDLSIYYQVAGLIAIGFTGLMILVAVFNGIDSAKIGKEYHDAPPPAPMNSKTTIRPREGGPVPDYIPKWQRPGYDPNKD